MSEEGQKDPRPRRMQGHLVYESSFLRQVWSPYESGGLVGQEWAIYTRHSLNQDSEALPISPGSHTGLYLKGSAC